MIHADLDKIIPEADALDKIQSIFNEVEQEKELYVITKSGRPAAAIINIEYLEELTGKPIRRQTEGVHEDEESKPVTETPEVKEETGTAAQTPPQTEAKPAESAQPAQAKPLKPVIDLGVESDSDAPIIEEKDIALPEEQTDDVGFQGLQPTTPQVAPASTEPPASGPTPPPISPSPTPYSMPPEASQTPQTRFSTPNPTQQPPPTTSTPPLSKLHTSPNASQALPPDFPDEDPTSGSPMG